MTIQHEIYRLLTNDLFPNLSHKQLEEIGPSFTTKQLVEFGEWKFGIFNLGMNLPFSMDVLSDVLTKIVNERKAFNDWYLKETTNKYRFDIKKFDLRHPAYQNDYWVELEDASELLEILAQITKLDEDVLGESKTSDAYKLSCIIASGLPIDYSRSEKLLRMYEPGIFKVTVNSHDRLKGVMDQFLPDHKTNPVAHVLFGTFITGFYKLQTGSEPLYRLENGKWCEVRSVDNNDIVLEAIKKKCSIVEGGDIVYEIIEKTVFNGKGQPFSLRKDLNDFTDLTSKGIDDISSIIISHIINTNPALTYIGAVRSIVRIQDYSTQALLQELFVNAYPGTNYHAQGQCPNAFSNSLFQSTQS